MSEFRAEGIEKRFRTPEGELEILRGADLFVGRGESIGILGVSGSGKSTLLHILGGLERPSAGRVVWDGIDLYTLDPPALARFRNEKLGFVFQFHHLLPEFSALENVMMPCLLGGWSQRRARERAAEMLESVEVILLCLNREAGTALVLVTHNETLASSLTKMCYLVEGRLAS